MAKNLFPLKVGDKGDKVATSTYTGVTQLTLAFGKGDATAVAALPAAKDLPSPSDDNALLEFFARKKGTTDWGTAIGSIKGFLCQKAGKTGKQPFFDAHLGDFKRGSFASDFTIDLVWTSDDFNAMQMAGYLRLPWELNQSSPSTEVSVQITLDGNVVTPVGEGTIEVILKHTNVPTDGTSTTEKNSCFGAGTVYPVDVDWLKAPAKVAYDAAKGLNVYLHESVRSKCEKLRSGSFNFGKIKANVTTILGGVGFTSVNVAELSSSDAKITGNFVKTSSQWTAKNVSDPNSFAADEGTDLPFYDFYIFLETGLTPNGGEAAHSEALNTNDIPGYKDGINTTTKTKREICPIQIVGASDSPFETGYKWTIDEDNAAAFIADLVCHEIGHSFGLRHAVDFDGSSYKLSKKNAVGTMSGENVDGGKIPVKMFGPVHTAVLKRICGLS